MLTLLILGLVLGLGKAHRDSLTTLNPRSQATWLVSGPHPNSFDTSCSLGERDQQSQT